MVKKTIIIGHILFNTILLYSQINTRNISFQLRYPVPAGNNFINKGFKGDGYIGIIDLGVDYNIFKNE